MPSAANVPGRGRRRPSRLSGDERERAILDSAAGLLRGRPLHRVSIDDIARGAGISRPTFYFYFASKDDVLLALLDQMVADARRRRDAAVAAAGDDPVRAWRAGIEAFFRTWRANRDLLQSADGARASSAGVRELWQRVIGELVDETAEAIEAERARGAAPPGPPARDLATALTWMNERVFATTFGGGAPAVPAAHALDTLLAVWLAAVYGGSVPARR